MSTCRLEHVRGAARVDTLRVRRIGHDLAYVGDRGEVRDRIAAMRRIADRLHVREVADVSVELVRVVVGGRNQVEDARLVAGGDHGVDDVRTDEAGSSGDQDLHAVRASSCSRSPA